MNQTTTSNHPRNINVLLPPDMHATLRSLPGGLSISDHVRLALVKYLKDAAPIVAPNGVFVDTREKRG